MKKRYIASCIGMLMLSSSLMGCGSFFDDIGNYENDVNYDVSDKEHDDWNSNDDGNNVTENNENLSDLYEDEGSFSYDTEAGDAFANYEDDSNAIIGLWFEDGNLDGYSITISGNGTWVQHGESVLTGYLETESSMVYLYNDDGTMVGMLTPWGDGSNMTMECVDRDIMDFHLDPTTLTRDTDSTAQGSLQDYYDTFFRYEFMMGAWYPDGDTSSEIHFTVDETGQWSRYFNEKESLEYGYLEDIGDGYYSSTEINFGDDYVFYYPGDGSLWINDEQYFRAE